jgi:hypothetical protein
MERGQHYQPLLGATLPSKVSSNKYYDEINAFCRRTDRRPEPQSLGSYRFPRVFQRVVARPHRASPIFSSPEADKNRIGTQDCKYLSKSTMPQLDVGKGILTEAETALRATECSISQRRSETGSKSSHAFGDDDADCKKMQTNGVSFCLMVNWKAIE